MRTDLNNVQHSQKQLLKRLIAHRAFYVMLIPAVLYILIFCYAPMGGVVLAFKKFKMNAASVIPDIPALRFFGTFGHMEWVGLDWFKKLFAKPDFWRAFSNTLQISLCRLLIEFPVPILLALIINEMRQGKTKKIYQTLFTFPHFLSWVLVVSLMRLLFQSGGTINAMITAAGGTAVNFLSSPNAFRPMLYLSSIWKDMGCSRIIYMAAIAGIDPTLYEAASLDGAWRWKSCWHITWPSIRSTAVILLILQCGNILNAGFDQVFNMQNDLTLKVSDIFDTFINRYSFQ